MNPENFEEVYLSGFVKRHHTNPSDVVQLNSAHQWGVAMVLEHLMPECSKLAIMSALSHDVAERWTGDVPAYAKWNSVELTKILGELEVAIEKMLGIDYGTVPDEDVMVRPHLTQKEIVAIKLSDLCELLLFSKYRIALGDTFFYGVENNVMKWFARNDHLVLQFPALRTFFTTNFRTKANPE